MWIISIERKISASIERKSKAAGRVPNLTSPWRLECMLRGSAFVSLPYPHLNPRRALWPAAPDNGGPARLRTSLGGVGGPGRHAGQERVPRLVAGHGVALAWCPSGRRPGED